MDRVNVSGATLAYKQSGRGAPVVLVHGVLVADAFEPLLTSPSLTSEFQLTAYHRRGYGHSSRISEPISIARQAGDCRELLDRLGIGRAHIVGHSFGGAIAFQLALDAPERVHTLALIEPALAIGESGTEYRESLVRAIERYRTDETEALVAGFLEARTPGCRNLLDRLLPGAFAQAVQDARVTFDVDLPGLLGWSFGDADAERISRPTLSVLGGESGKLAPRFSETHEFLIRRVPHCEGVTLSGTTHFPQLEAPPHTASALSEFWCRHMLAPGTDSEAKSET